MAARSKKTQKPSSSAGTSTDRSVGSVGSVASIEVRGARQHNLRGIDVDIPLGQITVVTGPSGSGKSSLAFDTVYAEGQRRYVETFSPYVRQFFERMDKPQVDDIRGIPPAIAIEQAGAVRTTRSTVGTMTEINDYLKLLFPRLATANCPSCQRDVRPDTPQSAARQVVRELAGREVLVVFSVPVPAGTAPADFFGFLQAQGFLRIRVLGKVYRTDAAEAFDRPVLPGSVEVIQDRIRLETAREKSSPVALPARLLESLEQAFHFGKGMARVVDAATGEGPSFSRGWHCASCDVPLREPTPALFSFNNAVGACPVCRGFGRVIGIDMDRAMPDHGLSIRQGLVRAFQGSVMAESQKDLMRCAKGRGVDVDTPFEDLPKAHQRWVIEGDRDDPEEAWREGTWYGVRGFFKWCESKLYKMHIRVFLSRYRAYTTCGTCGGGRLQPEALNFRIGGATLPDWWQTPVSQLAGTIAGLASLTLEPTVEMLRLEVETRLRYLDRVGLGYLALDRAARTLSGGEVQRVNLTSCLGASLVNTLFVMDEPSVGLHPRDVGRMLDVMRDLRDKGNTLLVVEHEESVIRAADHLLDIGPGRGLSGGQLVYAGTVGAGTAPEPLKTKNRDGQEPAPAASLTLDYLSGEKCIPVPKTRRRPAHGHEIQLFGAAQNNLRKLDVDIPLGLLVAVTGVSGSGKSTLIHEVLYAHLARRRGQTTENEPGRLREMTGDDRVANVVMVDQSPLSRTPRSTPAVYIGAWDSIRAQFAATAEAKAEGLTPSYFSFNSGTGRCQRCQGAGFEKVEMQFLSDLFVKCPACDGTRFSAAARAFRLDGRSVHEVLEMTVAEALEFFDRSLPAATTKLRLLAEVGLDYLKLGQPLNTLSGGESQRLKLVAHLSDHGGNGLLSAPKPERASKRPATEAPGAGRSLLIFDEPTTGLHFDDIALLLRVFHRLVDAGHSLVVIEHNIDVIKNADWVIDLGPEAGVDGGTLVAAGTPETVAQCPASHTGRFLSDALRGEAVGRTREEPPPASARNSSLLGHGQMIALHGAREHNLKNLSLEIPRDQFVVITGLSGSGKSTLAFDILFAEGQRRFLDSMSPYARQFAEQLERPDIDHITGLPPTVAIEQRLTRGGGKSTVATVTEVYHFLRLLYAKVGTQFCPSCEVPVTSKTVAEIAESIAAMAKKGAVKVQATVVKGRKGFHTDVAEWAERQGFSELWVDGQSVRVAGFRKLERFREHTIDVVVAALTRGVHPLRRIEEIVERALAAGKGAIRVLDHTRHFRVFSSEMSCSGCGTAFEPLDPRLFSFNSPHGWCPECRGFGTVPERAVLAPGHPDESMLEAELRDEMRASEDDEDRPRVVCPACEGSRLNEVARAVRVQGVRLEELVHLSVSELAGAVDQLAFTGRDEVIARDIVVEIAQRMRFMEKVGLGYLELGRAARTLSGGESQRIRLAAQLGSNLRGVLYILDEPTIGLHPRDNVRLLDTLTALRDKGNSVIVVEHDEDTMRRADRIYDLGPGAGMFGGSLVAEGTLAEICAVKESPTGQALSQPMLHPLRGSRRPVDGGPTAKKSGGSPASKKPTRRTSAKAGASDAAGGAPATDWLTVTGCRVNNLRDMDISLPLRRLTVITGVSGSGKSSFMRGVLRPAVSAAVAGKKSKSPTAWRSITGADRFDAVYEVDQSPIGKTSRSTPATYIGIFDDIRKLFAGLPESRMRGFTASRFSFNTEGGRCEACKGNGQQKLEMAFLPSSWVPCDDCHGLRYNSATLEVEYNGKNIGQVMRLTIDEAAEFFSPVPSIARTLRLLVETGVGYLQLGQPSPTLSGGEAQRIKLVTELTRGLGRSEQARLRQNKSPRGSLYLIEEPTIGLHPQDVRRLIEVLHRLVDDGHTVVVIEHNLDVAAEADWVLDIGPDAGDNGGNLVACGSPETVAQAKASQTAPFLRAVLQGD
jgi:excinuclease ABC subunit A